MGAAASIAVGVGEELLVDLLAELGLIEISTEIGFNIGADNILIPLTETSLYSISNGGYAAAGIFAASSIGGALGTSVVDYIKKGALNAAVNKSSELVATLLEKTKSITFWTKIDSKRPLNSPNLLQNVIYETLQEVRGGKAWLECVRSSKRRIKSVKRKGMVRRKRQNRISQTPNVTKRQLRSRRKQMCRKTGVALNVSEDFWDETVVPNSQGDDPRYSHLAAILPRETPIENVPLFERKKRDKIDDNKTNADKNENDDDDIDMPPEIP
ncbi:uncharacterized protein TNCT_619311 [Trichonephila clavata]|uniref:Uncharacterized protein n=1 Tax=Trichonephila clavata TaxID=2740835 RepID=A0A8X6KQQ6_TRICU|nr:uncharacterized protein TNCT_619311 [Trichonephila clavata]